MLDGDFGSDSDREGEVLDSRRWGVFIILLVISAIMIYSVFSTVANYGATSYVIIFYTAPLIVLGLYASYRWARGRPIAPINPDEDERILAAMERHALRAEKVSGFNMYGCPDCGMSFELTNATPIEENVVLCPVCGVRLYIDE